MGLGGISLWQLLIVLVIVVLLFGTKRLRSLGGDLGSAIRGFRAAMHDPSVDGDVADARAVSGNSTSAEVRREPGQTA